MCINTYTSIYVHVCVLLKWVGSHGVFCHCYKVGPNNYDLWQVQPFMAHMDDTYTYNWGGTL